MPDDEASIDRLGRVMAAALDTVKSCYANGNDFAFTLIVRHRTDPNAHAMVGDDSLEGVGQFLCEMAAAPDKQERNINRHLAEPWRSVEEGRA